MAQKLTKIKMHDGSVVYSTLIPNEIRQYFQGQTQSRAIPAFEDQPMTVPIILNVQNVVYIYTTQI